MVRQARVVVPGIPHHVTQRGNNRQDVFFEENDRLVYLKQLKKASEENQTEVYAYCLMTNHIHLVATPNTESALARTVGQTHLAYTLYFNDGYVREGHLWHSRFYSCPLDGEHYWRALRYVECNPVRAELADQAWDYVWSSVRAHLAEKGESQLLDLPAWRLAMPPEEWRAILGEVQPQKEVESFRANTYSGRPMGDEAFIKQVEEQLERSMKRRPPGRPRGADGRG